MEFPAKFNENLILHDISIQQGDVPDGIEKLRFCFEFFNEEMIADVSRDAADVDNFIFDIEGFIKLFDSFQDAIENDYYEKIKELFNQYEKEETEKYGMD